MPDYANHHWFFLVSISWIEFSNNTKGDLHIHLFVEIGLTPQTDIQGPL